MEQMNFQLLIVRCNILPFFQVWKDRFQEVNVPNLGLSELNISCQYKPTQNMTEMFLFDLQTVIFLVLEKARSIAAIHPFRKRIPPNTRPNCREKSGAILIIAQIYYGN